MGQMINAYTISAGKLTENRPLGRLKCECENMKIYLKGIQCKGEGWICLAHL
jgi:hypothetical protein